MKAGSRILLRNTIAWYIISVTAVNCDGMLLGHYMCNNTENFIEEGGFLWKEIKEIIVLQE